MIKDIQEMIWGERPLKWLFFGDSITQGVAYTFGSRDYTELFAEEIQLNSPESMVCRLFVP